MRTNLTPALPPHSPPPTPSRCINILRFLHVTNCQLSNINLGQALEVSHFTNELKITEPPIPHRLLGLRFFWISAPQVFTAGTWSENLNCNNCSCRQSRLWYSTDNSVLSPESRSCRNHCGRLTERPDGDSVWWMTGAVVITGNHCYRVVGIAVDGT